MGNFCKAKRGGEGENWVSGSWRGLWEKKEIKIARTVGRTAKDLLRQLPFLYMNFQRSEEALREFFLPYGTRLYTTISENRPDVRIHRTISHWHCHLTSSFFAIFLNLWLLIFQDRQSTRGVNELYIPDFVKSARIATNCIVQILKLRSYATPCLCQATQT